MLIGPFEPYSKTPSIIFLERHLFALIWFDVWLLLLCLGLKRWSFTPKVEFAPGFLLLGELLDWHAPYRLWFNKMAMNNERRVKRLPWESSMSFWLLILLVLSSSGVVFFSLVVELGCEVDCCRFVFDYDLYEEFRDLILIVVFINCILMFDIVVHLFFLQVHAPLVLCGHENHSLCVFDLPVLIYIPALWNVGSR